MWLAAWKSTCHDRGSAPAESRMPAWKLCFHSQASRGRVVFQPVRFRQDRSADCPPPDVSARAEVGASQSSVNGRIHHGGTEARRKPGRWRLSPPATPAPNGPSRFFSVDFTGASHWYLSRSITASAPPKYRFNSTPPPCLRASVVNPSKFCRRRFQRAHTGRSCPRENLSAISPTSLRFESFR